MTVRNNLRVEDVRVGEDDAAHSDPDLPAEDVAPGYKNVLEAQRGFRDLKSTLELRRAFHRLEHRIRARPALLAHAARTPTPARTHRVRIVTNPGWLV